MVLKADIYVSLCDLMWVIVDKELHSLWITAEDSWAEAPAEGSEKKESKHLEAWSNWSCLGVALFNICF